MAPKVLFHEKIDVRLMRLVRENPVLYDYNHPKYMDFNTREVAWQKIGDELKRPSATCKGRWINIRDVYRRILKKNSEPGQRPKHYKYDEEVSFLRPFYKETVMSNDDFDDAEDRAEVTLEDFANDDVGIESDKDEEPEPKPKVKRASKSSTQKKKKKHSMSYTEDEDPISTSVFHESTAPSEFDSSDPIDAFLLSIGATLRTFSPYHLNLAKSKIFSVVQEHDLQQIVQKTQSNETLSNDIKVTTSEGLFMQ